jgi:hypothetical protein
MSPVGEVRLEDLEGALAFFQKEEPFAGIGCYREGRYLHVAGLIYWNKFLDKNPGFRNRVGQLEVPRWINAMLDGMNVHQGLGGNFVKLERGLPETLYQVRIHLGPMKLIETRPEHVEVEIDRYRRAIDRLTDKENGHGYDLKFLPEFVDV